VSEDYRWNGVSPSFRLHPPEAFGAQPVPRASACTGAPPDSWVTRN